MMSNINMRSVSKIIITFIVIFISLLQVNASPPTFKWDNILAKYPDEMAIFLKYHEEVNIDMVGDSVVIESKMYRDMLHMNDQSSVFAKSRIYTSHFVKVSDINARTLVPHKKKYKTLNVTQFKESNDDLNVFFDDTKYISFIFPGVQPKARTILEYKESITDPHFLSGFYFTSYVPIMDARYTIRHHKNIQIEARTINPDPHITFEEKTDGDYIIKTWRLKNVPKKENEKNAPALQYVYPHVIPRITRYTHNNQEIRLLSNTDDLYRWYSTWIDHLEQDDDTELQEIVQKITSGIQSRDEKIKNIFYWVQNNIKYIAFEEGMRGLIPHKASYVYKKRFGDCKDMASITVSMLKLAGIDAYYTWIGTRNLPYKYTDLPGPMVDNHMIAAYRDKKQFKFLDATGQYMSAGLPTSMIQGKEAMIALDPNHYEIITVPVISREENIMRDDCEYQIDESQITGEGKLTLSGYVKVFNTYHMIKSKKESVDKYVKKLLSRGSNKFSLDHYEILNLENLDKPIEVDYKFHIKDYINKIGDEIYVNLNLDKSFYNDVIDIEKRKQPIENEYKYTNEQNAVFHFPSKFEVEFLPENRSFENDVFGFSILYEVDGNKINVKKYFYVNYLMLDHDSFDAWNDAIKQLSAAYRDVLILKQNQ